MRRFLMLLGVAAVAGAMYVAAAPGSQQASGPTATQFSALKKQVASLSKTLKTVKAEAVDADGFVRSCLVSANSFVVPIGQFGDPNGTFGYKFTADGTTLTDTTALDVDGSATPAALIPSIDPSCVSGAALHRGKGGLLRRAIRMP